MFVEKKIIVDQNKTCLHYEVVTDNDMVLIAACSMLTIETNTVKFIKKQKIIIQRSRVSTFPNKLNIQSDFVIFIMCVIDLMDD